MSYVVYTRWMRAASLLSFVIVAACQDEGDCPVPLVSRASEIISIDGFGAFSPDVLRQRDGRYVAYVPAVTFGDGALFRLESDDGLDYTTAERVIDGSLNAFVMESDDGFVGFFETPYGAFGSPPVQIAKATSADGIEWSELRVVFGGTDNDGVHEVHSPKVVRRDDALHLYFTSLRDVCVDDTCDIAASIGHAVSVDDGDSFTFDSWIFRGGLCDGTGNGTLQISAFARAACPETCAAPIVIIASGRVCGDDGSIGVYEMRSDDAISFSAPTLIANSGVTGTILVGSNGAVTFGGNYADGSRVFAMPAPDVECVTP